MKEKAGLYLLAASALALAALNLWGMCGAIAAWQTIGLLGLVPVVVSCFVLNAKLADFAKECIELARDKGEATECSSPRT